MTSFFVNLPSNSGPQTFPNNTAATFDTKFDLVRRLDGEWSVALVAMSHPAKINNVVNGFYDVATLLQYGSPHWIKWQRIYVPDGYYTESIDMWADMIRAIHTQHHVVRIPEIPFMFDTKHGRIVVAPGTMVRFSDGISRALGHSGPLVISSGARTIPGVVKPVHTTTDIFHVQASIVDSQQIFGDSLSPLLRLVMYTGVQDEKIETIYHEFGNLHYKSISAKMLDTLKIKITDEQGESVKFQDGKVVLTLHFKQKS